MTKARQVPELLAIAGHWSKGPQMVGQLVFPRPREA